MSVNAPCADRLVPTTFAGFTEMAFATSAMYVVNDDVGAIVTTAPNANADATIAIPATKKFLRLVAFDDDDADAAADVTGAPPFW